MAITFLEGFSAMEDPRIDRKRLYPLLEIIFLTPKLSDSDPYRETQDVSVSDRRKSAAR